MQHLDEGTIHAWLDGALDAAESARVEAHAAECAECSARVAEARGLIAASSRILTALDDVPGGVIPQAPAQAPAQPQEKAAAPGVLPLSTAAPPARVTRRRWGSGVSASKWRFAAAAAVVVLMAGTSVVTMNRAIRDDYRPVAASEAPATTDTAAAPPADLSAITAVMDSPAAAEKTDARVRRALETSPTIAAERTAAASGRAGGRGAGAGSPGGTPAGVGAAAGPSAAPAPPAARGEGTLGGLIAGAPARQARADSVARAPSLAVRTEAVPQLQQQQSANLAAADEALRKSAPPPAQAPRAQVGSVTGGAAAAREEPLGAAALRDRARTASAATRDSTQGFAPAPSAPAPPPQVAAAPTRAESVAASDAARATAELRARQAAERELRADRESLRRLEQRLRALPASFAGCYALTLDGWSPAAPPSSGDAAVVLPPRRIELTAAAAPTAAGGAPAFLVRAPEAVVGSGSGAGRGRSALRRAEKRADADRPESFWRPAAAGDSLEVVWSDGSRGLRLRLLPEDGGVLRGEARTFSDGSRPEHRARAVAIKEATCAR